MNLDTIGRRFTSALDALVGQIRRDSSVLAAILCGSLSHDTVWEKSDIDLVLVTIDDKRVPASDVALSADGINVHAILMPRAEFRKTVEGSLRNSFVHSLLAKGRLLYTHDPTIADLCDTLHALGSRDTAVRLLQAGSGALSCLDKARKWFVTREDLNYSGLWILYAATPLAQIEVLLAGQLLGREVIPQAVAINPRLFEIVYSNLLNEPKSRTRVQAALDAADGYVARHTPRLFAPIVEYLRDAGEARSCKEIEDYFKKNFDLGGAITACEYLADRTLIGKASIAARLTRRSTVDIQELAFFFTADLPDGR
jgi:uncharacterized protein